MLWWELESWPTKNWGIGEKRSRTPALEESADWALYPFSVSHLLALLADDRTDDA